MAYNIKYHGFDVTCDTADDLRALLDDRGTHNTTRRTVREAKIPPAKPNEGANSEMSVFIAKLPKEQRELVRIVASHGPILRERLTQQLGVNQWRKFAGLLIGISKSAAGSGIESPLEKITDRVNGSGPRTYQYKIRDSVKTEVKEALSK
jgi:hypothetical protein